MLMLVTHWQRWELKLQLPVSWAGSNDSTTELFELLALIKIPPFQSITLISVGKLYYVNEDISFKSETLTRIDTYRFFTDLQLKRLCWGGYI